MYVETVPNRNSPPAILLREGKRVDGRVVKRTLANLSSWPKEQVEMLRLVLRNKKVLPADGDFEITRSRAYGNVAAVLGTMKNFGLLRLLDRKAHRHRQVILAMIAARILKPTSKLAMARGMDEDNGLSIIADELNIAPLDENDLYSAMDWLHEQQARIERGLAKRHLVDGTLVLYDVSSSYFEGRKCPLARHGYSRDKRFDRPQIVYGLLCNRAGVPVAVEVFSGNTGDPTTVAPQVKKLRKRFRLRNIILVGDRGMITDARIRDDLKPNDVRWISALRNPALRKLCDAEAIQMSLFDEQDLVEIQHPDFPDERLVVCRNPALADERLRKRQELLADTERELDKVVRATARKRNPLRGREEIAMRLGPIFTRKRMKKHFSVEITDESFSYKRRDKNIEREAALDGLYVIRTNVNAEEFPPEETVRAYKDLARVERAFRTVKGIDLSLRPIHHRLEKRVRAHVFLCMLAYYVEWHMRRALAPVLFQEDDPTDAASQRTSIVAPAQRSSRTKRKLATKKSDENWPIHSFATLLENLGTIAKNRIRFGRYTFDKLTLPTPFQEHAFSLLQIRIQ